MMDRMLFVRFQDSLCSAEEGSTELGTAAEKIQQETRVLVPNRSVVENPLDKWRKQQKRCFVPFPKKFKKSVTVK